MIRKAGVIAVLAALPILGVTRYSSGIAKPAQSSIWVRDLITQHIDEDRRVVLRGNTRPEATLANDRGGVPDDFWLEHMLLQLKRSPEQEQALEEYMNGLTTHGATNYHQWLSASATGANYGLSDNDLNQIESWLKWHGIQVNVVYPNRLVMDISGTAAQLREAMRLNVHFLEVNGESHFANMNDPEIPEALAPAVEGIVSVHDFRPHRMSRLRADYTESSGAYTLAPGDLAAIYNLNPLFSQGISGQGQTVVVVEDSDLYSATDVTTFRNTFGLNAYSGSFSTTHPAPLKGITNCNDPGVLSGNDFEAAVDAEWVSAAAPGSTIQIATCKDTTTFGGLLALENIVSLAKPPSIISMSYGECEAENGAVSNAAFSLAYQTAALAGISVFVSTGDEGAASCDANASYATHGIGVSGFASTPYNVAVGGTDFGDYYAGTTSGYWNSTNSTTYTSAKGYVSEIPWNDSCAGVLLATYEGYAAAYGTSGFCNATKAANFITTASGSGGPSNCATGTPSTAGVANGSCKGYAKPSWQSGLFGNPSDAVRDLPDVSLFAGNGLWGHYYVVCYSHTAVKGGAVCTAGNPSVWSGGGGTSFSAPILAAMQALVNQRTGSNQGNPNPTYYAIAKTEYGATGSLGCNSSTQPLPRRGFASACVFYDVTLGDIDVNCRKLGGASENCYLPSSTYGVLSKSTSAYQIAYGTNTGWDFATGIGTVNAYNLVFSPNWTQAP